MPQLELGKRLNTKWHNFSDKLTVASGTARIWQSNDTFLPSFSSKYRVVGSTLGKQANSSLGMFFTRTFCSLGGSAHSGSDDNGLVKLTSQSLNSWMWQSQVQGFFCSSSPLRVVGRVWGPSIVVRRFEERCNHSKLCKPLKKYSSCLKGVKMKSLQLNQ